LAQKKRPMAAIAKARRCPQFLSIGDWNVVVGNALLGGGGGDPRSETVGGAQRSGPWCCA
jgi:hypothetical protein